LVIDVQEWHKNHGGQDRDDCVCNTVMGDCCPQCRGLQGTISGTQVLHIKIKFLHVY